MGRHIRNTSSKHIRLVTIRCEQALLLLTPDEKLNQIVGGVIARYQQLFGIILYGHIVMGNHIHLLARAPRKNLWKFEQAINREIAKRVNRYRNRTGHFFGRRYDEQIAVEQADELEALLYIICNPVKHALVQEPQDWPGLTCYSQVLDGGVREYLFTDYTAYRRAKRMAKKGEIVRLSDFETPYPLIVTPLPQFADLAPEARKETLEQLIREKALFYINENQTNGAKYLGRKSIRFQSPFSTPYQISNSPRPLCYTKSAEARKIFRKWFFEWEQMYREASKLFRSGCYDVEFPPDCLLPPMHYAG